MKKLTAVPVDVMTAGERHCFGCRQRVVFVELDCDEQGRPVLTDENERRFHKLGELVEH